MSRETGTGHEVIIHGKGGKILKGIIQPAFKFYTKDILQIIVGASILAIPVGFTEETWKLGERLPVINVIGFVALSLLFISAFVYYNYYTHHIRKHGLEFVKRVLLTYVFAFLVVSLLLTMIQLAPWTTDFVLAFKRTAIVTFPASMSAAVADMIK